jgi:hypothetical protein
MNYARTHRGFLMDRGALPADDRLTWYGNAAIGQLYDDLLNPQVDTRKWEWQKRAIEVVQDVFQMTPHFLLMQIKSGQPMPPRAVDFIHSTMTFIKTGRRSLSVLNWLDLLDHHPDVALPVSYKVQDDFKEEFSTLTMLNTARLITLWLQQPMGLQDMVQTAYALFGPLPEGWDKV